MPWTCAACAFTRPVTAVLNVRNATRPRRATMPTRMMYSTKVAPRSSRRSPPATVPTLRNIARSERGLKSVSSFMGWAFLESERCVFVARGDEGRRARLLGILGGEHGAPVRVRADLGRAHGGQGGRHEQADADDDQVLDEDRASRVLDELDEGMGRRRARDHRSRGHRRPPQQEASPALTRAIQARKARRAPAPTACTATG